MKIKTKSQSAKQGWQTRKRKKTIKTFKVAAILASIITVGIFIEPTAQATQSHWPLPQSEDKTILSVADQITIIAKEESFDDADYLLDLAWCESRHKPDVLQYTLNSPVSADRGLFQINDYWHREVTTKCALNIDCATRWTINQLKKGKHHEWMCHNIIR